MESHRDASPAKSEDGVPEMALLNVSESTAKTSRGWSPSYLSTELRVRALAQEQRMEFMRQILEEVSEMTSEQDHSKPTLSEVQAAQQSLQELHELFVAEHGELVRMWPPSQCDHAYFARKTSVEEAMAARKARRVLARLETEITSRATTTSAASTPPSAAGRSRLPELTLPTFDGDYRTWPEFKATFTSLIGDREDVTDLARFQYLQGAVAGEAAQLIVHLPAGDGSYGIAWNMLTNRYENKRLNAGAYLERLVRLRPMKQRKASSLTKLANIITETTQAHKDWL